MGDGEKAIMRSRLECSGRERVHAAAHEPEWGRECVEPVGVGELARVVVQIVAKWAAGTWECFFPLIAQAVANCGRVVLNGSNRWRAEVSRQRVRRAGVLLCILTWISTFPEREECRY